MNSEDIGKIIRLLRNRKNLSQSELAEKLGLSFQQVQKYENGRSKITVDRLYEIADALEVSVYGLMDESMTLTTGEIPEGAKGVYKDPFSLTEREHRLLSAYRSIKEESVKKKLLLFLESLTSEKP